MKWKLKDILCITHTALFLWNWISWNRLWGSWVKLILLLEHGFSIRFIGCILVSQKTSSLTHSHLFIFLCFRCLVFVFVRLAWCISFFKILNNLKSSHWFKYENFCAFVAQVQPSNVKLLLFKIPLKLLLTSLRLRGGRKGGSVITEIGQKCYLWRKKDAVIRNPWAGYRL